MTKTKKQNTSATKPAAPDYAMYVKYDEWSKSQAAYIITGIDPEPYRGIRFNEDDLPPGLEKPYALYRVFRAIDFREKYGYEHRHPISYIEECLTKNIRLPKRLQSAMRRLKKHFSSMIPEPEIIGDADGIISQYTEVSRAILNAPEAESGSSERQNLLKLIGALAFVLDEVLQSVYKNPQKAKAIDDQGHNVNVSKIVELILQFLSDNDYTPYGLAKSNLHKKISEALTVFLDSIE